MDQMMTYLENLEILERHAALQIERLEKLRAALEAGDLAAAARCWGFGAFPQGLTTLDANAANQRLEQEVLRRL